MATLERIVYVPHRHGVSDHKVIWTPIDGRCPINGLPQIVWTNDTPWQEANHWALDLATSRDANIKTVLSCMTCLHAYARWLEDTGINWWHFPQKKAERCLVQYRGALKKAIENGQIAPSTASQRMSTVVRFYRWLIAEGLFSPTVPLWRERTVHIRIADSVGLARTIAIGSTDLAIRNRRAPGDRLEDGLLPVAASDRARILELAKTSSSEELFLMLTCGFFTGMRLGSISDLRIETLERAVADPASDDLYRISLGPGASPPVHTKFGVTGQVRITRAHLDALKEYFYSRRRLERQALASPNMRNVLFLTRFGNSYANRESDKSPAVNVEMLALRRKGLSLGIQALRHFKFHQTRCTFATELAELANSVCGAINAVAIVMEFLLHRDEATSLRYIKYIQKHPLKREAANAFTRAFYGAVQSRS